MQPMLALSDTQLAVVMTAAASLPIEKRQPFLERVAALLTRIRRPADADVEHAARVVLQGLIQAPAA
jgi:hypothetical protein